MYRNVWGGGGGGSENARVYTESPLGISIIRICVCGRILIIQKITSKSKCELYVILSEGSHSRELSGLHSCWERVKSWLTFSGPLSKPVPDEPSKVKIKCLEIEVLDSYEKDPGDKF
jgi:hypothetical protein